MNPVMYIILNKGAEMSTGKAAAQAAHAAVEAYKLSCKWHGGWFEEKSIANRWNMGGHYTKIVLEEPNAESLGLARAYIEARGFKVATIIDEGRTEFDGKLTWTALGVEIVDKDSGHVGATFSSFKLYKDEKRPSRLKQFFEGAAFFGRTA